MIKQFELIKIQRGRTITLSILVLSLLLLPIINPVQMIKADPQDETDPLGNRSSILINEGFESGIPTDWSNTGWLLDYYGSPHNGSNWIYSWAAGDTLITPSLNFDQDTVLSFWYCAEIATNPMDLELYIDTNDVSHMIWNDTGFTHTSYQQVTIDLSGYTGDHTILFIGMTSDMRGQLLDDILITTTILVKNVQNIDTGEYFDTIQEAIDDKDTQNGHTIEVSNGTYRENIIISKQLVLQAASTIVIDAMGGTAITINDENVVIDGFTIMNATDGFICNAAAFTIEYNTINASNNGISFSVHDIGIKWNGDENLFIGPTMILCNDINVDNNGIFISANNWGKNMHGSASMQVGAFIIDGNTIHAQRYGIDAWGFKWWGNDMQDDSVFDFKGLQVTNNMIYAGLSGVGDGIGWEDLYFFGQNMNDNASFILGDITFNNNIINSSGTGLEIYTIEKFGGDMKGSSSFLWTGNFEVINNNILSLTSRGLRVEYLKNFGNNMNDSSTFIMNDILIKDNVAVSEQDDAARFDTFREYGYYMGESASFTMGSFCINNNTFITNDMDSYGVDFYEFDSFGKYMRHSSTMTMGGIEIQDNTIVGGSIGWENINIYCFGSNMFDDTKFTMQHIEIRGNLITANGTALDIDELNELGYKLHQNAVCSIGDIIISDNILTSENGNGLELYDLGDHGTYLYDESSVDIGDILIRNNKIDAKEYGIWVKWFNNIGKDLYNNATCTIGDISFSENRISNSTYGVNITYMYHWGYRIFDNATLTKGDCNIASNQITNCTYGLALMNEENITVQKNIIQHCLYGIYITENGSLLYNNFLNNTNNAYDLGHNKWNIDPPVMETNIIRGEWLGGNYWSDYTGVDTTGDGLGDTQTPHNSSGNIIYDGDFYPLVEAQLTNTPPEVIEVYPIHGESMISRPPVELNATIGDNDNDLMTIIFCFINHTPIDHNWETISIFSDIYNGSYNYVPPKSTTWIWGNTTYTWSVNVTDGVTWTNETFTFTTGGSRYDVTNDNKVNYLDPLTTWNYRTNNPSGYPYDGLYDVNDDDKINYIDALTVWANRGV